MMANKATITNRIRIPGSVLSARGGRERSLPSQPLSQLLLFQRVDKHCAGILRHALERLAIERNILVGHQAAPPCRNRYILLAPCHVADDASVVADAVVVSPDLLAPVRSIGVHYTFGIRPEPRIARCGSNPGKRRPPVVDPPILSPRDRHPAR